MASDKTTPAILVEFAIPMFAERPFDAVSTRQIARRAGVNLSAISYHFGSKEGLYTAIFEKIIADLAPVRSGFATLVDNWIDAIVGNPEQQRAFISLFVDLMIDAVLSQPNPAWRMQLIMREVQSHGPNFDLVRDEHVEKMQKLMCRCVAAIVEDEADSISTVLTSQSILSLCLQYGLNQELIKSRLGLNFFSTAFVQEIKQITTSQITGMLRIPDKVETK